MREDFAVFILSHGRPNNVKTYKLLGRSGYTGKVYIVIDDEDETGDKYRANFGKKVLTFSKEKILKKFDKANNFQKANGVVYARNACFDLAKQVNCRYFMQLDDDYYWFGFRFTDKLHFKALSINKTIDPVLESMIEFMGKVPRCSSLCMSQGGDWIGGVRSSLSDALRLKRKAMNTFVCDTERRFIFQGEINEDVNTYVGEGGRGSLFFTFNGYQVDQSDTQSIEGGMTEFYLNAGTFIKSFYTVMMNPSCVKIGTMGRFDKRLHHIIRWNNAVPKILREDIKR